jgi:hypothetical protein
MRKNSMLVLGGAILLIAGGFMPWISVPNLFGLQGESFRGIEIGWEGDSVVTIAVGALLLVGAFLFGSRLRWWHVLVGAMLAALAAFVALSDFARILEIDPPAGFFAASGVGLYVTLGGALAAFAGCAWKWIEVQRAAVAVRS